MVANDQQAGVAEEKGAVSAGGRCPWLPPGIKDVSVEMTRKTSSTMESTPGDVKIGS